MIDTIDTSDRFDADVAIVGCGPVGNTLAILLAQHGHRVVVLERWPEPYPLPRAVHFDHEVARVFQSAGCSPNSVTTSHTPTKPCKEANVASATSSQFAEVHAQSARTRHNSFYERQQ